MTITQSDAIRVADFPTLHTSHVVLTNQFEQEKTVTVTTPTDRLAAIIAAAKAIAGTGWKVSEVLEA